MITKIQTQDIELTDALRDYTNKRLAYALSHSADHIQRVQVRLMDVNGPRGGVDKSCQVAVHLKRLSPVLVEDIETDLYVAIDRAVERMGRTLARRLSKQRRFVASPDVMSS